MEFVVTFVRDMEDATLKGLVLTMYMRNLLERISCLTTAGIKR